MQRARIPRPKLCLVRQVTQWRQRRPCPASLSHRNNCAIEPTGRSRGALDSEHRRDEVREFAAFLRSEYARTFDKVGSEVPCNWKFVPENLMDLYRVGVIHRTSLGPMPWLTAKVL